MSFSKIIHAQLASDNGEAGARVRKNAARNAQAAPKKYNLRRMEENTEELKPRVIKRVRKRGVVEESE
jgi:hypothetical protein